MDGLELGKKVCFKHRIFVCMDQLKLLPDTSSGRLTFDLDEGGAVDGSINDFLECHLPLLVGIDQVLVGLQFIIGKWYCGLWFMKLPVLFL